MKKPNLSEIMRAALAMKSEEPSSPLGLCLKIAWAEWREANLDPVVVTNEETGAAIGYRYIAVVEDNRVWTLAYAQQDSNGFYSFGQASGRPANKICNLMALVA